MIPNIVRKVDIEIEREEMERAVQSMSVAELESISIEDISSLGSNILKDIVNDAIRHRLEQHLGGTYTSPPKMSLTELRSARVG
jgi:hypothetical protein